MNNDISELLRQLDPARDTSPDRRARQDLTRILRTPRPRLPRRRIATVLIAAGTAIVLFIAQPWATDSGPGSAHAGMPPLLKYVVDDRRPANAQLLEMARRVAALPPDPPPSGPVLRVEVSGWYLVSGENTESHLEEQSTVRYILNGRITTDDDPNEWGPAMFAGALSTDPAILTRQLQAAHPPENGPSWLVTAISDLYKETAPGPRVRAAVLTLLARLPQVRVEGKVADRMDRPGTGFSITTADSGLPTQTTLIFDPNTGRLLDVEQTLTERSGNLNLPIPSVIEYQVYPGHRYVAEPPR